MLKHRTSPAKLILLSFAAIILFGSFLLMLPVSAVGAPITFVEALFTSTSAVCVTGLSVIDIGTRLSMFGQIVLLILIQAGGLGIMTFSTFFIFVVFRRLSIRNREVLLQSLSQHPIKDMGSLLLSVFLVTILIEAIGAAILFTQFSNDFPFDRAIYLSVFHAVSAFCNAGFSPFAGNLMGYVDNATVNVTVMLLIITGGLGFIVIFELYRNFKERVRGKRPAKSYHAKLVLRTTIWLILVGAALLFAFEWSNVLAPLSLKGQILASIFQSVSARTCGYNSVDIGLMTDASLAILIILMYIGASPASTGGGVKTSTFAVVVAMVVARFRDRDDVNLFGRRIAKEIVSRAVAVAFFSAILIGVATLLLLLVEAWGLPHSATKGKFIEYLFEVTSAFGTVGLSTGITQSIDIAGRIILILMMYVGRVGPLTLAIELAGGAAKEPFKLPSEERILIG